MAPPASPGPPQIGVTVSLDAIYATVVSTEAKVTPLTELPGRLDAQERRIRSLENWRLVLLTIAMGSFGTTLASLFQHPLLQK